MSRANRLRAAQRALHYVAGVAGGHRIPDYGLKIARAVWGDFWPPAMADEKAGQALRTTLRRLEA